MLIKDLERNFLQIDGTCYIAPGCRISGNVDIGKNSSVLYNAVLCGDIARISIGESSNLQNGCVLHCSLDVGITVGNYVTIGHGAVLNSCSVDDFSLVGMGAVILDGAKIGKYCLIAAGAVITPNTVIPDESLVIGSPGKVMRRLTVKEIENIKNGAHEYIKLAGEYLKCRVSDWEY